MGNVIDLAAKLEERRRYVEFLKTVARAALRVIEIQKAEKSRRPPK